MLKNFGAQKIILAILLILIIAAVLIYPRLQRLNSYTFVDETFYLKHGAQFYWAVANQEYADTDLVIHPGVSTLWLGAAAFRIIFPEYQQWESVKIPDLHFRKFMNDYGHTYIEMQVYTRGLVVLFNSLCLVIAFLLLWRLAGKWLAAGAILLVGFTPYFFDFSRFFHIDGMLSTLMLLALLGFMLYLKEGRRWTLALTAFAVALATLTKVIGLIVLAVIGLLALWEWLRPRYRRFDHTPSWLGFKKLIGTVLALTLLAALTAFILWPALWVNPLDTLGKIVSFTLERSTADSLSPMFFNGEIIPTGVFGLEYFYYYPLTFLWHSTPITLFGLAALLALFIFRPKALADKIPWHTAGQLLLFVLFYTVLITLSKQKFDRYLLPAYLPLDILSAFGWWFGGLWLSGKLKSRTTQAWLPASLLGAALLIQGFLLFQVFPYGISYFNPLMGGPKKAPQVLQIGSGEGLDLAAEYLSSLPKQRDLVIRAPFTATLDFHYYRQIDALPLYEFQGFAKVYEADYVVLYLNQIQRGMSAPIVEFLADKPAEHTVVINGIEYAKIYHMSELVGN